VADLAANHQAAPVQPHLRPVPLTPREESAERKSQYHNSDPESLANGLRLARARYSGPVRSIDAQPTTPPDETVVLRGCNARVNP